jgi:hypothetical protein
MENLKVINRYKEKETIYIGRGSPLGNPYRLHKGAAKGSTLQAYSQWIKKKVMALDTDVMTALLAIKDGDKLGCFCKPQVCHGDIIVKIVKWLQTPTGQKVVAEFRKR